MIWTTCEAPRGRGTTTHMRRVRGALRGAVPNAMVHEVASMITLTVARLWNERENLWTRAGSLAGQAAAENRAMSFWEAEEWDQVLTELERSDRRLRGALAAEAP